MHVKNSISFIIQPFDNYVTNYFLAWVSLALMSKRRRRLADDSYETEAPRPNDIIIKRVYSQYSMFYIIFPFTLKSAWYSYSANTNIIKFLLISHETKIQCKLFLVHTLYNCVLGTTHIHLFKNVLCYIYLTFQTLPACQLSTVLASFVCKTVLGNEGNALWHCPGIVVKI